MEIGFGQLRHFGRSAKTFHALAAFDPADLVAKLSRNPDVVILALRHVQDFGLLVAECRLPAFVESEEFRIRFGDAGIVGADGVVERVAERVGVGRQSDAVRIGHRDQAEFRAQALQRLDRIRKWLPAQHRKLKGVAGGVVHRQAELAGEVAIDMEHHLARPFRVSVAAALVGRENLVVTEFGRRPARNPAHGLQHAGLEIDQGTDDVEGENLEPIIGHFHLWCWT